MKKTTSLKALFIGNSFTARNNMPGLVELLAAAGDKFEHRLISIGGASLRTHWNKGEAAAAIDRDHYDFVVLQEQSTLPIKNPKRMHENVRLFDELIRAAGSRTALYMTWARLHTPRAQDDITQAYTSIAKEIGATLIPAGIAWQLMMRTPQHVALHDKDGSHPTLAGSFLAACVAYRALIRKKLPSRVQLEGLASEQIVAIYDAANAAIESTA